jgi:hypothetical protein
LDIFIGKGKFGYEPIKTDILIENEKNLNISDNKDACEY